MRRNTGFSPATKALIRDRAQNLCEVCGQFTGNCVAHHRRPRGAGGSRRKDTNQASNGIWVCAADHLMIETERDTAFENGWLVHQEHDPSDVPVVRRGRLVWLDDEGNVEQAA